jgi:hypothetical protein
MQWYKILARILLMLCVTDFALAAPVTVQGHEVRVRVVDAVKPVQDETATSPLRRGPSDKWLMNAAGLTNAPIPRSSDSGHWRDQEPRQHDSRSRTESNGSPEPSNPPPPIDLNDNYSPSPSPPHIDSNANHPASPSLRPGSGPTSPIPTSQTPPDEPGPLNPSSPHGNADI